jgi:hypothetical protein
MRNKPFNLEKFKEDWQRQVMADPTLSPVTFRVSIAISWHMNRKKGGLARISHTSRRIGAPNQ